MMTMIIVTMNQCPSIQKFIEHHKQPALQLPISMFGWRPFTALHWDMVRQRSIEKHWEQMWGHEKRRVAGIQAAPGNWGPASPKQGSIFVIRQEEHLSTWPWAKGHCSCHLEHRKSRLPGEFPRPNNHHLLRYPSVSTELTDTFCGITWRIMRISIWLMFF